MNGEAYNNLMTENTLMGVEVFANSEKIGSPTNRWFPTAKKDNNDYNNDVDIDVDDNFQNYVKKDDQPEQNQHQNQQQNQNQSYNPQHAGQQNNNNFDRTENNFNETEKPKDNTKFIDDEYEALSPIEKRLRRLDIMRKLGELRDLGCKVTNYNIDDDYYMMKYEHDLHLSIRAKRNWLGLYSHLMIGAIKGAELVNNNYNPFDFSLKGLSDEVSADKNTYYEILGEIYEYHNVPGKKMNPWFRLIVTLLGVVVVVGGKNNAHKFMPNKSESVEADEAYIEKLRARAANDNIARQQQQSNNNSGNNAGNNGGNNGGNNLDSFMNKQHEQVTQKIKDLEELKRQELEYQQYQRMLAEERDKFNQMKRHLEMSASGASAGALSQNSAKSRSTRKSESTKSTKSTRKSELKQKSSRDKDTISQITASTTSRDTNNSGVSQISINRNLAGRLKSQLTQNMTKKGNISMDQISFGKK